MQAWLCENPIGVEALQWKELPTPEPKAGEVRIAMRAASLNFPDLLIGAEQVPGQAAAALRAGLASTPAWSRRWATASST